jgi:hypothetical protein
MTDWFTVLTGALATINNVIRYSLNHLEQRKATKTCKRFANAPVANRWYTAWREQKGLIAAGLTVHQPVLASLDDAAPPSTERVLNNEELDTLLASFYGVNALKAIQQASAKKPLPSSKKLEPPNTSETTSPALTAKQRLLEQTQQDRLANQQQPPVSPEDRRSSRPTQKSPYLSQLAQAIRHELGQPIAQTHAVGMQAPDLQTLAPDLQTLAEERQAQELQTHAGDLQTLAPERPSPVGDRHTHQPLVHTDVTLATPDVVAPMANPLPEQTGKAAFIPDISVNAMVSIAAQSRDVTRQKPFATQQVPQPAVEGLLNTDPSPLAHLAARNQFLSNRINRLADQYFQDLATNG